MANMTLKLTPSARQVLDLIDCQGWFDYYANLDSQTDEEIKDECDRCDMTIQQMREQIALAKQCLYTEHCLSLVPGCDLEADVLDHLETKLADVYGGLTPAQKRAGKKILAYFEHG